MEEDDEVVVVDGVEVELGVMVVGTVTVLGDGVTLVLITCTCVLTTVVGGVVVVWKA